MAGIQNSQYKQSPQLSFGYGVKSFRRAADKLVKLSTYPTEELARKGLLLTPKSSSDPYRAKIASELLKVRSNDLKNGWNVLPEMFYNPDATIDILGERILTTLRTAKEKLADKMTLGDKNLFESLKTRYLVHQGQLPAVSDSYGYGYNRRELAEDVVDSI